ncbi:lysyl oxidase family protein [Polyangium spumosum]|uniref:Lysyl oxidase n=1 Tax=Polyangium spumosum TaxID=889282 RepID=A0A6N7Q4W2_9BACT|nr:lysyl oxidase family protein [Polyangium spumosum]MRG97715.1 hypothetical protein [Polyangium spumosum]
MRFRRLLPLCFLPALHLFVPGCSVDVAEFDIADAVATIDTRARPGDVVNVQVDARNSGQATWVPGEVTLALGEGQAFPSASLALAGEVEPGARGTFTGKLTSPVRTGLFKLNLDANYEGARFGDTITTPATELTCSDGVYCNGAERLVAGQCVSGTNPCDDGAECTTDTCDEAKDTCAHELGPSCAACTSDCTPDCTGKACGDDGCGGVCATCPAGEACVNATNECKPANQPGSCAAPLELLPAGTALLGVHQIQGDTTGGLHESVPTCNSTSTAAETVYTFTLTEKMGIEARVSGYDTVIHLRKDDTATPGNECIGYNTAANAGCSDDASPPGDYGSRVDAALDPGTYYLIVDGFDASQYGPFDLQVKFTVDGCVPHCDGLFCGTDDGCGGDCGTCPAGEACTAEGRCRPDPCVPDCGGKQCGDDGCGGTCGTCAEGSLCVPATSKCQVFADCDNEAPVCDPPCGAGEFCGTDCGCHAANEAMPDLVIDEKRLLEEILFDELDVSENSCAFIEECVGGTGKRKLLRFSVEAKNQGMATLTVPPPAERPDLFLFSPCHGHYHFNGFATYALLDKDGKEIVAGRKQAYCMEDTQQIAQGPNVGCNKIYSCEDQGIQRGWSDLYGNTLDCQWLDITDVAPGEYFIQVKLNPSREFEEVSLDNNTATVPVTIQ